MGAPAPPKLQARGTAHGAERHCARLTAANPCCLFTAAGGATAAQRISRTACACEHIAAQRLATHRLRLRANVSGAALPVAAPTTGRGPGPPPAVGVWLSSSSRASRVGGAAAPSELEADIAAHPRAGRGDALAVEQAGGQAGGAGGFAALRADSGRQAGTGFECLSPPLVCMLVQARVRARRCCLLLSPLREPAGCRQMAGPPIASRGRENVPAAGHRTNSSCDTLRVRRLNEHARLPTRGSRGAAGYDLARWGPRSLERPSWQLASSN